MAKSSKSDKQMKITLVRSLIGRVKKHQETVQCLGLRKMHHSVIVPDNATFRGMVDRIAYLLKVEEC
jgi:large subunit ribosomal protein L30